MVLQVLPDTGKIGYRVDAHGLQPGGRADPGQHQQLRRADRPSAHDHLTGRMRLGLGAVAQATDAGAPAVLHVQPGDQAADLDGEVWAVQGGHQVGIGRADPLPVDGQVRPGHPVLLPAAEVPGGRAADRGQGRGEGDRDRVPVRFGDRGDPDRAAGAAQCRVAAFGVLAAPEIRQQVRESPAGRPARSPAVVDRPGAAYVRHGVDRAGPAQRPAPGIGHRPGIGLRAGEAGPVRRGAQQFRPGVPSSRWPPSRRNSSAATPNSPT